MGMNPTTLATAIAHNIETSGDPSLASNAQAITSINDLATAVANAVVAHIQANAVVTVTGTATAVTSGASTSPVTGTGTIS